MIKRRISNKRNLYGYAFISPAVIMFSVFYIYPMFRSFYLSLFEWNIVGDKNFIGFDNFKTLFTDERFINSVKSSLHFTFFSIVIMMFISFWIAYAFTNSIRFKNLLQSMIFTPVILTLVGVVVAWKFMFQSTGLISYMFIELFHVRVPWLTSPNIAPYSMIIVNVWKFTGLYMIMFLAGLLNIPEVYYEAATVDGAGFWQKLRYITLPQLKNTIILVFTSCLLFTAGNFGLPYVLTEGGPSQATEILPVLIYVEAFRFTKMGYASAMSIVYFIAVLLFTVIQLRVFRSKEINN